MTKDRMRGDARDRGERKDHGNRTGLALSPARQGMEENASPDAFDAPGSIEQLEQLRAEGLRECPPIGTMAPPAPQGTARSGVQALTGARLDLLVDKLAERLAFERGGTRLYDTLLLKLETNGSFDGGPSQQDLEQIRGEELEHVHLLMDALAGLGADPTVMTPCADLVAVESTGLVTAITDPRTTLAQGLHAILVAELADNEGWRMLCELAQALGQDAVVERCRRAEQEEGEHLRQVRGWLDAEVTASRH